MLVAPPPAGDEARNGVQDPSATFQRPPTGRCRRVLEASALLEACMLVGPPIALLWCRTAALSASTGHAWLQAPAWLLGRCAALTWAALKWLQRLVIDWLFMGVPFS